MSNAHAAPPMITHRNPRFLSQDQPACERRNGQRRYSHGGGYEGNRQSAPRLEPRRDRRDHRCEKRTGGEPDLPMR